MKCSVRVTSRYAVPVAGVVENVDDDLEVVLVEQPVRADGALPAQATNRLVMEDKEGKVYTRRCLTELPGRLRH